MFKYLTCSSTTPEGLCYEAIMDDMVHTTNDRESYFLNFSDGMPMYSNDAMYYQGDEARNHTRDMVKKMRNMRIKVLLYFISSGMSQDRLVVNKPVAKFITYRKPKQRSVIPPEQTFQR